MHYEAGMGQVEIAKQLGLSRPTVSRLLQFAQDNGIVQIKLSIPFQYPRVRKNVVRKVSAKRGSRVYAEYENYQNLSEFSVSNNTEQYFKREYEDYMKNIEAKMIIWIHVKMGVLVKLDGIMHI